VTFTCDAGPRTPIWKDSLSPFAAWMVIVLLLPGSSRTPMRERDGAVQTIGGLAAAADALAITDRMKTMRCHMMKPSVSHSRTRRAVFPEDRPYGDGGQIVMGVPELDLVVAFMGGKYGDVPLLLSTANVYVPAILPAVE
jgi:hypothetical protein